MANATEEIILARRLLREGVGEAIRRGAGLSFAEFGASLDPPKPASTIYRWEKGSARPRGANARSYIAGLRLVGGATSSVDLLEDEAS